MAAFKTCFIVALCVFALLYVSSVTAGELQKEAENVHKTQGVVEEGYGDGRGYGRGGGEGGGYGRGGNEGGGRHGGGYGCRYGCCYRGRYDCRRCCYKGETALPNETGHN
eukprot:Gb_40013 [translate_table: standard]